MHPGETPASYMLQGLLDFLASSSPAASSLLNRYVFHVIPVLNPDGVASCVPQGIRKFRKNGLCAFPKRHDLGLFPTHFEKRVAFCPPLPAAPGGGRGAAGMRYFSNILKKHIIFSNVSEIG